MANELYVYTTPPDASVRVTLDSGIVIPGSGAHTSHDRSDAHLVQLPGDTPQQGMVLAVDGGAAYVPFTGRGIVQPSTSGEAHFLFDDVHLAPMPTVPDGGGGTDPGPQPPDPGDPLGIILWVYGGGTGRTFDLSRQDGCGQFTEACCLSLYTYNSPMWGHIKKNPGQNQYNGHAVDAVMCLAGAETGIWDIIKDSVSHNAEPVYNYAGPADPSIWYPAIAQPAQVTRWTQAVWWRPVLHRRP